MKSADPCMARPPSSWETGWDRIFRWATFFLAWGVVFLLGWIVVTIFIEAYPAFGRHGLAFLTGTTWDPVRDEYGLLPAIIGTLYSSVLALIIASIFGVGIAIFLSEDFLPPSLQILFKNIVELLAAIPSVVYGLWGLFVVIPLIRPAADWFHHHLGWIPLFSAHFQTYGMLPAALVLAIMVLPTITAVSRDALTSVPPKLREGAMGLGATRWEAILKVILPTAAPGIVGSIVLGFGRALGETMALAMLVGNANTISWSILSPANTIAALIANQYPEAGGAQLDALMYAALVLMVLTLFINIIATLILRHATRQHGGLA